MLKNIKGLRISESKRLGLDKFIEKSNQIHNYKYKYDKVLYINAHTHVDIECPLHGVWSQIPMDHINGKYGCPKCGNIKKGKSKSIAAYKRFLEFANIKHKGKYTYIDSTFCGMTKPMEIICPIHNSFMQSPDVHKRAGCQRCGSGPVSESSQKWLDSLNVLKEFREIWIKIGNKRIKVDAFDAKTNTVYEFWGDYWHGNPSVYNQEDINLNNKKKFQELYNKTQERISLIKSEGYNLIQIWEKDWLISINNSSNR